MQVLKKLIKKIQANKDAVTARKDVGIFSGAVGLLSNFLLFLIKAIAGSMSGSVAIMADAINNLSDGVSSLFTVVGFYASAKPADKEHPYGHQRAEYISGLAVSFVILYIGLEFLFTSIGRVTNPQGIDSSPLVLTLLLLSVVAKLLQGRFYSVVATEIQSVSIKAVGRDAYNDVFMSVGIILSYLIESVTGWHIDGFIGIIIALIILKSGIDAISAAISRLLGEPPSPELIDKMKAILDKCPELIGYHDLYIHKYGPSSIFATVDVELNAKMPLAAAHQIIDGIEREFLQTLGVHLVSHIDPIDLDNRFKQQVHDEVKAALHSIHSDLHFHDFQFVEIDGKRTIQFDVVIPESLDYSDEELRKLILVQLGNLPQEYPFDITFDRHYLLDE